MDYIDRLPGAEIYRVTSETRAAIELSNAERVQDTISRHREAFERLRQL